MFTQLYEGLLTIESYVTNFDVPEIECIDVSF